MLKPPLSPLGLGSSHTQASPNVLGWRPQINVRQRRNRGVGGLSKEGQRSRREAAWLSLQLRGSVDDLVARQLACAPRRPGDRRGQPAAVSKKAAVLMRREPPRSEVRQMNHRPKAVARADKLCPAAAAVAAGLMPQNTTARPGASTSSGIPSIAHRPL
jgi:hypothetical protein